MSDVQPLVSNPAAAVVQGLLLAFLHPQDVFDRSAVNGSLAYIEQFQLIHTNLEGGAYFTGRYRIISGSNSPVAGKEALWKPPSTKITISWLSAGTDPYAHQMKTFYEYQRHGLVDLTVVVRLVSLCSPFTDRFSFTCLSLSSSMTVFSFRQRLSSSFSFFDPFS